MKTLFLFPQPQSITYRDEAPFLLNDKFVLTLPEELDTLAPAMLTLGQDFITDGNTQIHFTHQPELAAEAYTLNISSNGIEICWGQPSGAFYALMTLKQIAAAAGYEKDSEIPACTITDYPQIKNRGYMLDISRGKVPTVESLKTFIDMLAAFKYNHFELYIEGFSFMYASFPKYCDPKNTLTPQDVHELDAYCRERFIDLVPNQNCYGHMGHWLAQPEFRPLAEAPDGWTLGGSVPMPPTTLDARNEACIPLIKQIFDDLLPHFTSQYFNVDMDEPFDMGLGKNTAFAEEFGKEQLYLMHALKVYELVVKSGKTMMMWGDVVEKHPNLFKELPEDIIFMDWGYEGDFPVERHAKLFSENHRRFYICPGTNSWNSCTGLTDSVIDNITHAVSAANTYGAEGILLTDWGDGGHYQYLPVSYAPMALSAALTWNRQDIAESTLTHALDMFIFKDASGQMGQICLDAGRYYHLEEFIMPCRTMAVTAMDTGCVSSDKYIRAVSAKVTIDQALCQKEIAAAYPASYSLRTSLDAGKIIDFINELLAKLGTVDLQCEDGGLVVREYINGLTLVKALTLVRKLCLEDRCDASLAPVFDTIMEEHEKLWMARNKRSGLNQSMSIFKRIHDSLLK